VDSIFDSVGKLVDFPTVGRIVPEIIKNHIREILCGQYRIIYSISDDRIDILTVRHGMQILPEDEIE
jgi:plasmid stabilization system protein ParE